MIERPEFRTWALPAALFLVVSACGSSGSPGDGAELHVSAHDGDDNASGSAGDPFATISACAAVVEPGQSCVVHAGTYRETVRPANSGTAEAPIRFVAAGEVVVTGLDVLEGWTKSADGAFEAKVDEEVTQVLVDGRMFVGARWPNLEETPLLSPNIGQPDEVEIGDLDAWIDDAVGPWTYLDGDFDVDPDVATQSRAWILNGFHWVATTGAVVAAESGRLSIEIPSPITSADPTPVVARLAYSPRAGDPYFLYGNRGLLDAPGEWFYDDATGTVSIVLDGDHPGDVSIEGRRRTYGFDLENRSYVEVTGFDVVGAAVRISGDYNTLQDCSVLYAGVFWEPQIWKQPTINPVSIAGRGNVVRGCEIAHSWSGGVVFNGDTQDTLVTDNIVHDLNWAAGNAPAIGMDASNTTWHTATPTGIPGLDDRESSENDEVSYNTLCNVARAGIEHRINSKNLRIVHNDISNFTWMTRDGGGIYSIAAVTEGTEIAWNRIHDAREADYLTPRANIVGNNGIYLDNGDVGMTVHHNEIWGVRDGFHINSPGTNHGVFNNTIWDVEHPHGPFILANAPGGFTDVFIKNNLVFTADTTLYPGLPEYGAILEANLLVPDANGVVVDLNVHDVRLTDDSPAIDAGVHIPGITEEITGAAPDVGAHEKGTEPWEAGARWRVDVADDHVGPTLSDCVVSLQ